jgi:hypothetical protein
MLSVGARPDRIEGREHYKVRGLCHSFLDGFQNIV